MAAKPPMPASVGTGLRDYAAGELTAGIDFLAQRGPHLHDGVHFSRKAIRRTRAALSLAEDPLGPGGAVIDRALRRLNKASSWQRDAHALVQVLERLAGKHPHASTHAVLTRALGVAKRRRTALVREPRFIESMASTRATLRVLRAGLDGLPWDAVEASHIERAIAASTARADKARTRVLALGKDVLAKDRNWHRWRRRMRRRSQQARAADAAGVPSPMSTFDKSIAEQLGLMQDLSLIIASCGSDSPFDDATRKALRDIAARALARQRKRLLSVTAAA